MKKVFNPFTMNFDLVPFNVYQQTRNPGENDDTMAGFNIGDEWTNTETMQCFKCTHNATGEAMWRCISVSSTDKNMVFYYCNATVVTMDHFMGKIPAVTIVDEMEEEIMGDVDHVSINRCVVTFNQEISGKIILN
jgi:hypothetical protein